MSHDDTRFPNETREYRAAREQLLEAEKELRVHVERVAEQRRGLPLGGEVAEDYEFDMIRPDGSPATLRLSELFADGKDSLAIYSFMFGPDASAPCPMCTAFIDSLDRTAPHAQQRINLAVVAKSPIDRVVEFGESRDWRGVRLLSSAGNTYNRDYRAEDEDGNQLPALNVFVRRGDKIHHSYNAELVYEPAEPGQNQRHMDLIWPLWNLFDVVPEGRGTDWFPSLSYEG